MNINMSFKKSPCDFHKEKNNFKFVSPFDFHKEENNFFWTFKIEDFYWQ